MARKIENENSQSGLHPALVAVTWPGGRRWTVALWEGQGRASVQALRRLMEARLLAELSMAPAVYLQQAEEAELLSFDLASYEAISPELGAGLGTLGFSKVDNELDVEQLERLSVFRNEARKVGRSGVGDPVELWRLEFSRPANPLKDIVKKACISSARRHGDQVFGDRPGWPSKWLVEELSRSMQLQVGPDSDGLERLCALLIDASEGELGWVEPMAFQAICDFLAVVLQASGRGEVEWASSPVDAISGLAPPPMARLRRRGSWKPLELGRDVMTALLLPYSRQAPGDALRGLVADYLR